MKTNTNPVKNKVLKSFSSRLRNLALVIIILSISANTIASEIKGVVKASRKRYLENTVIYIDKIEGKQFEPPEKQAIFDQINMKFVPHVLPVLVGTTVDFYNGDAVRHNVFTPEKIAEKFNLGSWKKGESRSYTFMNPGVAAMLCNVHPEMEAFVVVVETPYFAVTDKDGNFTIKDVPPGEYTLKIWNEKLKGDDITITVPAEGDVSVEIELKR